MPVFQQFLESFDITIVEGDDELPALSVGNVEITAEFFESEVSFDTELRHQRAGTVVETRMYDGAVSAARTGSHVALFLKKRNFEFTP